MVAPKVFAIAQVNGLGDVVCCLPMAAAIKAQVPGAQIIFIGREYSRALIESSSLVDRYLDAETVIARPQTLTELGIEIFLNPYLSAPLGLAARRASVPVRVGNWLRPESLRWTNRFIAQASRTVQRHRALLNLAYLRPLGLRTDYSQDELNQMVVLDRCPELEPELAALLDPQRFNLVLHPKSNNSAPEWPVAHFEKLVDLISSSPVKIFVTGSKREASILKENHKFNLAGVIDLSGQLEPRQFIAFLKASDGMVASSTGPLHIAAAVGNRAIGLYAGTSRTNASRWRPLGRQAEVISASAQNWRWRDRCPPSASDFSEPNLQIAAIRSEQVAQRVLSWII